MVMTRPLRVGLAGIAALYWPNTIARGIRARRDVELVSFATLGAGTKEIRAHLGMDAEQYAAEFGLRPYEDLDAMMATERLDAVALCARHTQHAQWVERLAPYGADIFIAKTFATTIADADRICAAASRHRVRIVVGPSARYLPWFAAAKKAMQEGRIGKPFSLRISHHHGTLDVFGKRDFYRDPAEGGPELSLGWYLVDLVLHLLEQPVTRVSAEYGTFTTPDSPFMDCGRIMLRLEGGAIASCEMFFCNRFDYPVWEMEVVGEKGAILVRQSCPRAAPGGPSVTLLTGTRRMELPVPVRGRDWELFWIDEFRGRASPSVTAAYAREVTRICLAAREAARKGRTIRLGGAA